MVDSSVTGLDGIFHLDPGATNSSVVWSVLPLAMNVVFHALVGGAAAHGVSKLWAARSPGLGACALGVVVGVASHGVLDWLRHDYPVSSRLDVVLALTLASAWVLAVRHNLRALFALTLAASFLPDVVDHAPRLLARYGSGSGASPARAAFPWHEQRWSGSLYPQARIRSGSGLVALESGDNREASHFNHGTVVAMAGAAIYFGRSAFRWRPQ